MCPMREIITSKLRIIFGFHNYWVKIWGVYHQLPTSPTKSVKKLGASNDVHHEGSEEHATIDLLSKVASPKRAWTSWHSKKMWALLQAFLLKNQINFIQFLAKIAMCHTSYSVLSVPTAWPDHWPLLPLRWHWWLRTKAPHQEIPVVWLMVITPAGCSRIGAIPRAVLW